MAFQNPGVITSYPAGEDFSSDPEFPFVELNASGQAIKTGAGELAIGVSQNGPSADGSNDVVHTGVTRVTLGATVAAMAVIASDANGAAVAAGSGDYTLGIALEGGDAGEVIAMLLAISGTPLP